MLSSIKKRLPGSIKKRLYLLTCIVGVIMLIMVLVFIWSGNTLTMITAIARFERTHTISRVEAIHFFYKYYDQKKTSDLNSFTEKWAITQSYHLVFGNLLEMRTTKSKKELADIVEKTFAETNRNTSEILVNRIHLLYWHPLIIGMVENAKRARELGLMVDDQVKIILGSDSVAINNAAFREIERITKSFRILEDDFTAKSGVLGSEIAFMIKLLSMGMLLLSVALTSLVAFLTIRSISIPIGRFIAYSKDVAGGNIDAKMPEISGDELLSLSESMAILLSLNQRLKQEVDEKTQMANALQESEAHMRALIETIPDLIWLKDPDGVYISCNPKFERFFGAKEIDIIGKTDHDFLDKELADFFRQKDKEAMVAGKPSVNEEEVTYADDGHNEILETVKTPMYDSEGKFIGVLGTARDISERKKIEAELQQMQKLESIGILAGGIAHDFNNILAGIITNIYLSKMDIQRDSPGFNNLESAEKAILRAKDLTQRLLTFARGGDPVTKAASIVKIIKESAEFILTGSNVICDYHVADDLLPAIVDEGQISQVIQNLVLNSSQAMPEGRTIHISMDNIELVTDVKVPLEEGRYVKIVIQDKGTGMSEEHLTSIFDPYFTTKDTGRGLGLSIAYSVVKSHKGHISVESEIGAGTTFTIYLPASERPIEEVESRDDTILKGHGKILLMDDEEMIRKSIGQFLEISGYEVEYAEEGNEAIALYKKAMEASKPFDAVILDMTIRRGMGGKESIKKLLGIDPDVKAIVSSGYSNDPIMADFREYGFSDVLAKPFNNPNELIVILHRILKA